MMTKRSFVQCAGCPTNRHIYLQTLNRVKSSDLHDLALAFMLRIMCNLHFLTALCPTAV